jgi:hypothetical protein
MKFTSNPSFAADFAALPTSHQKMFRARMKEFSDGCDKWVRSGAASDAWPGNLRVHRLSNSNLWSMTWHYRRPDGRAVFQFYEESGETKVRWLRVGGHEIYDEV